MHVSIVVCTYSLDTFENLVEAIDSLLNQTYKNIEIVIVVDGNEELYNKIVEDYGSRESIKSVSLKENMGVAIARNTGIRAAQGDVIAFFDDDAVADTRWVENLVDIYQKLDAISVGGKIVPLWLPKKPDYFPEELGWLVGMTQEGFANDKVAEVRNTWESNMSFKREVFEKIGLFNEKFGFVKGGKSYIQGIAPEFTLRMKDKLGKGVIYNPEAIIYHRTPAHKARVKLLLKRAFYQGYTKALLKKSSPSSETLNTEVSYLNNLLFSHIPHRIKEAFSLNFIKEIKQLSLVAAVIISVGLGFVYGYMKR